MHFAPAASELARLMPVSIVILWRRPEAATGSMIRRFSRSVYPRKQYSVALSAQVATNAAFTQIMVEELRCVSDSCAKKLLVHYDDMYSTATMSALHTLLPMLQN